MIGDRLLRVARALYGEHTAHHVFEPLVADLQREYTTSNTSRVVLHVRWLGAIARAFAWCFPRAFGMRMPAILFAEVVACAVCFPLAALIFQWREVSSSPYYGWRVIAVLSFTVVPIVWRFRVAAIPEHQRRALTRSYVVLLIAIVLGLGYEQWPTRWGQAAGIVWLAVAGWRVGDPARQHLFSGRTGYFVRVIFVGGCLFVASWPVGVALGVDFGSLYWQRQHLLALSMAFMTVVTLKERFNGFTSIRP